MYKVNKEFKEFKGILLSVTAEKFVNLA